MVSADKSIDEHLGHTHPKDPDRVTSARNRLLSEEDASRLAALFGMLADPVRARILYALDTVDGLSAGDLVWVLGSTLDAVGYGLRLLCTTGLVTARGDGPVIYYRLADDFPAGLREHGLHRLVDITRAAADDEALTDDDQRVTSRLHETAEPPTTAGGVDMRSHR